MHHLLNGVSPLPHLGVIRVQGEEAAKFLQGQLTQDFVLLGADQARLAGYCSAKGRLLASFIGWRADADTILLVTPRDVLGPTLKRLSMFVLRAKAKLSDATDDYSLYGLGDDLAGELSPAAGVPWTLTRRASASVVELYPADHQRRALWVAPAGDPAPTGSPLAPALWSWGEVRSGVAMVTAPIVEAFVPQMLNYESVGGVNFKKGCYPGQEVVARSQFRGILKRRAYLGHVDGAASAGQEVFQAADPTQPCGLVAQAAPAPEGGSDVIVSIQVAAAEDGSLAVGGPEGPQLTLGALPYPLLLDV
jgi:folate-binding protein YgfZ